MPPSPPLLEEAHVCPWLLSFGFGRGVLPRSVTKYSTALSASHVFIMLTGALGLSGHRTKDDPKLFAVLLFTRPRSSWITAGAIGAPRQASRTTPSASVIGRPRAQKSVKPFEINDSKSYFDEPGKRSHTRRSKPHSTNFGKRRLRKGVWLWDQKKYNRR